jgi:hypothetical protein
VDVTSTFSGFQVAGGSQLQVLTVAHGWIRPERRAVLAEGLRDWHDAWSTATSTATTGDMGSPGWVLGCATFRPLDSS